jgi:hypothetical protein
MPDMTEQVNIVLLGRMNLEDAQNLQQNFKFRHVEGQDSNEAMIVVMGGPDYDFLYNNLMILAKKQKQILKEQGGQNGGS